MAQPTPPGPPLAFGEELTHTNADLSHLILDGLRGGGDGPGAPSPDGDHPDAGGDSGTESSPRVVARRTTVIEEVHIINEERR